MISSSLLRPVTAATVLVLLSAWAVTAQTGSTPRPHGAHGGHGTHGGHGAHEAHGTPPGWTFTLPKGDPARGRAAFERFECFKCHEVQGEKFPGPTDTVAWDRSWRT